jgi:anti-anti-sigma factor
MTRADWRWLGSADYDGLRIHAVGDLDITTAPVLDRVLATAIASHPGHHVVLDLHDVTFIDCAGLGVLIRARNRLPNQFWLQNVPPQVARLLDLTDLTTAFAVLDQDRWLDTATRHQGKSSTVSQPAGDARLQPESNSTSNGRRVRGPSLTHRAIAAAGHLPAACRLHRQVGTANKPDTIGLSGSPSAQPSTARAGAMGDLWAFSWPDPSSSSAAPTAR